VPPKVEAASQRWHNENNVVGLFLETCFKDGSMTFTQSAIHQLYVKWCNDHRLMPLSLPEYTKATWDKENFYLRHQGKKDGYKVLRNVAFAEAGLVANTVGQGAYAEPLAQPVDMTPDVTHVLAK
jgi:phage/plasmid-associated DNA primase